LAYRSLADPGLAQDGDQRSVTETGGIERILQPAQLRRTTDKRVSVHGLRLRAGTGVTRVVSVPLHAAHQGADAVGSSSPWPVLVERSCRAAQRATWVRDLKPSLPRMCFTWTSAVPSLMTRSSAISRLLLPWATNAATSRSRVVSGSTDCPSAAALCAACT